MRLELLRMIFFLNGLNFTLEIFWSSNFLSAKSFCSKNKSTGTLDN